jgi:hypothetical protein
MIQPEVRNRGTFPTRGALGLTGLALVLRGTLLFCGPWHDDNRAMNPDSPHMVLLAHNLRAFHTYGKAEETGLVHRGIARLRDANGTAPTPDANGLVPEVFRPPGYPFFLAVVETLFHDLHWALFCQCILGAWLTWLVVRTAWSVGLSRYGALFAGLLWAVQPGLIVYDNMLLTESLFSILAVCGLFVAARCPARYSWVGSGILIGLGGLVRPLALLYEPLVWAIAKKRGQLTWPTALAQLLLVLLPSGLWAVRNYAAGEGFRVSTVPEINLLYYSAAYSISEERGEDAEASWPSRVEELTARLGTRLEPGEDVFAADRRLAVEELQARPGSYLRVQTKSAVKLFVSHSLGDVYQQLGQPYTRTGLFSRIVLREDNENSAGSLGVLVMAVGWLALNAAICVAAFVGIIRGWRSRLYSLVVACVLTLILFTLATASVGLERMRMPMMLPLVLLSGLALQARVAPPTKLASPTSDKP